MVTSTQTKFELDHVTIRTRDLAVTREFFLNVFELEEKVRPAAIQRIPGTGFLQATSQWLT